MPVCPSKTKRQGKTEPRETVAEVFRMHGASYRRTVSLSFEQAQAMEDIVRCRTSALGGRLYRCDAFEPHLPRHRWQIQVAPQELSRSPPERS